MEGKKGKNEGRSRDEELKRNDERRGMVRIKEKGG